MPKVIVYTSTGCPHCANVKEYLKDNKIEFTEKNVTEDPAAAEEAVKKSGQQAVPIIDIDGEIVVGNDEEKLSKLLNIK